MNVCMYVCVAVTECLLVKAVAIILAVLLQSPDY